MKQKLLYLALLFIVILAFSTLASAATDPIVCTMEVTPSSLSEPGDVTITITVSNSGDTDMENPLTLFDPTSQVVTDFGEDGSVTLKAGEVKTWTGTWSVNQRTLENGQIVFFVKYTIVDEDGTSKSTSQPIRGEIVINDFVSKVSVTRTVVPETAYEGQTVNVIYDIVNEGNVSIMNLVLEESNDIMSGELKIADELKAGETAQVKLPVVMGTKDLTSQGTLTYTIADGTEEQTYETDEKVITYGEPAVLVTLSSDAKGAMMNETVKLALEVANTGNIDYTDVRVTDPTLGDVFTNLTLPAGETLTLEKEISLTQTTDYQFEVLATDNSGTEISFLSNVVSLIAVDPEQALNLTITLSSNKTEVYSTQEVVRFSATVTNTSEVDASNVTVYQANTEIATFDTIPAGETRTFSRDVTLSMAGQYQLSAEATDALENTLTFESNILQIAFLVPTPAPVTPDPSITATPEPTFVKATYPKISDPDIGTLPKLLRTFFYPLMIVGFGLLVVALVILAIATRKRIANRKLSEQALDQLERSVHRDYTAPADEQEEKQTDLPPEEIEEDIAPTESQDEILSEDELPHMKYVRNAYQIAGKESLRDQSSQSYAQSEQQDYPQEDEPWDQNRDDGESPYQRRSGRSPYARRPSDADESAAPDQEDHPEEPS